MLARLLKHILVKLLTDRDVVEALAFYQIKLAEIRSENRRLYGVLRYAHENDLPLTEHDQHRLSELQESIDKERSTYRECQSAGGLYGGALPPRDVTPWS